MTSRAMLDILLVRHTIPEHVFKQNANAADLFYIKFIEFSQCFCNSFISLSVFGFGFGGCLENVKSCAIASVRHLSKFCIVSVFDILLEEDVVKDGCIFHLHMPSRLAFHTFMMLMAFDGFVFLHPVIWFNRCPMLQTV